MSEQAIYRWKKQYAGLESDQVRELKVLQEENARLKRLVADLSLDKAILQDINSKNMARPALKRHPVDYVVGRYATSWRRACRLVGQHRSVHCYRSRRDPRTALPPGVRCGRGCGSWHRYGFATGIAACRCCCGARAGRRVRT